MSGMMSILESCFFLAVSILKLGQACTIAFGTISEYEFLWWFIAYIVMMSFHIHGGLTLWRFMSLCTVITVLTLFIYLFGSIPAMDFPRYAYGNSKSGLTGDTLDYFLAMRLPSWLFVGIDLLPLTSEEVTHVSYTWCNWILPSSSCCLIPFVVWSSMQSCHTFAAYFVFRRGLTSHTPS